MRIFKSILTIAAVLLLIMTQGNAQLQFKGYVENRLYLNFIDNDFSPSDLDENLKWGDYNRARVEMSADVSENSFIRISIDHYTYHGYLLSQFRQEGSGSDPVSAEDSEKISIDRAYLRFYLKNADVTIGKQRISWGQSLLWSPFDVFNRVNPLEPQEEKAGINAFRVVIPLGQTGSVEALFSPEATIKESRFGTRFIYNFNKAEVAVTALQNIVPTGSQTRYGFSLKADAILGLWFEGAVIESTQLPFGASNYVDDGNYFEWLFGADYSFNINGRLLMVSAEYKRNERGTTSSNRYNYMAAAMEGRTMLARDYMYSSTRYMKSEHTSIAIGSLWNMNDGGVTLFPSVSHSLFPNTDITVGAYIAAAKMGTEMNPPAHLDPENYGGNSVLYCWFKLYF